jgi:hypothetical protein
MEGRMKGKEEKKEERNRGREGSSSTHPLPENLDGEASRWPQRS